MRFRDQFSPVGWVFVGDEILPSDIGIIISQYMDPYEPTSMMKCHWWVLIAAQVGNLGYLGSMS